MSSKASQDALRSFLAGGEWTDVVMQLTPEEAESLIRENPEFALRLLWDGERQADLARVGEVAWHDEARRVVRERLQDADLPPHWASLLRLATESLLGNTFRRLPKAMRASQAQAWIRSLDDRAGGTSELAIESVSPEDLLQLVMDPGWMREKDPHLRDLLRRAVLVDSSPDPVAKWRAVELVGIAAIRTWAMFHASDEAQAAEWATRIGVTEDELRGDLVSLVRRAESLELHDRFDEPKFVESLEFFDLMEVARQLEDLSSIDAKVERADDVWVQALGDLAGGSGGQASKALELWRDLGDEMPTRGWAIQAIEEEVPISPEVFDRCMQQDSPPSGTWAALAVAKLKEKLTRSDKCEGVVEGSGLHRWWEDLLQTFRSGPLGGIDAPRREELLACDPGKLGAESDPFRLQVERCRRDLAIERDRDEARASDREWMLDLVERIDDRDSVAAETWSKETSPVTAGYGDGDVVERLVKEARSGDRGWWRLELPRVQQIRLRILASREFGVETAAGDGLRRMVADQRSEFERGCAGTGPAEARRLSEALDAICNHLLDPEVTDEGADSRLLEAFLTDDMMRFRAVVHPSQFELPVPRREPNRRRPAIVLASVIAATVVAVAAPGLMKRVDGWDRPQRENLKVAVPAASPSPPSDLASFAIDWGDFGSQWTPIVEDDAMGNLGRRWGRSMGGDELARYLGPSMLGADADREADLVDFEVAQEFVRRFDRHLRSSHPAGLLADGSVIPWSELEVRMPEARRDALLGRAFSGMGGIWTSNGRILGGSGESTQRSKGRQAAVYVIIEG